jgi:hypothetical protein
MEASTISRDIQPLETFEEPGSSHTQESATEIDEVPPLHIAETAMKALKVYEEESLDAKSASAEVRRINPGIASQRRTESTKRLERTVELSTKHRPVKPETLRKITGVMREHGVGYRARSNRLSRPRSA